ncbi:hypothetical protein OU415_22355 [Saccharopolyspora sp. WRP15-2]|uniref:Major facilitator superfamily (MFS) profile domain-containing protein n=1 Tax=Saccharopolyspora oryzae TaxID=2997343 RepID=A0ABT4V467_9PSEU|nr:hypothetical protein [Saccharopolyspora oryzae]MDA3628194.1 hypothetical protein [Saccharopolyspora oryzae]
MAAWAIGMLTSTYGQQVLGFSPLRYGMGTIALTLMAVVGSYAAQALVGRVGVRLVAAGAAVCAGCGAVLLTRIDVDGTYFADLFGGLVLFGCGLGAATAAGTVAALSGVPDGDAGVASATNTASFQIGGALGAAIATTVLVSHTVGAGKIALTAGVQAGFVAAIVMPALALVAAIATLRGR